MTKCSASSKTRRTCSTRTLDIAERCNMKLEKVNNPFPHFDVPDGFTHRQLLRTRRSRRIRAAAGTAAHSAAQGRLKHISPNTSSVWRARSGIIQQMQFSGYFLIVWDFIRYARER